MQVDRELVEVVSAGLGGLAAFATFLKIIIGSITAQISKAFKNIDEKLDEHIKNENNTWEQNKQDHQVMRDLFKEHAAKVDRHLEKPHYYDAVRIMHHDDDGVQ